MRGKGLLRTPSVGERESDGIRLNDLGPSVEVHPGSTAEMLGHLPCNHPDSLSVVRNRRQEKPPAIVDHRGFCVMILFVRFDYGVSPQSTS